MEEVENKKVHAAPKKSKAVKRILLLLLLVFMALQFFQPGKNNNDVTIKNDIIAVVPVPDSVQQLLKVACYDCHSNNTQYPWYTNIQPVGLWLGHHVEEGKEHLNFNEFANLPPRNNRTTLQRQLKKLEEIKETVEEGEMPLSSYTLIHGDARLSDIQKKMIAAWADSSVRTLSKSAKKAGLVPMK